MAPFDSSSMKYRRTPTSYRCSIGHQQCSLGGPSPQIGVGNYRLVPSRNNYRFEIERTPFYANQLS